MIDFAAITRPPAAYDPAALDLTPMLIGPTLADWQWEREQFAKRWLDYLGHGPHLVPLEPQTHGIEEVAGITRTLISYQVEEGCRVEAYLLRPPGAGPFPGVVVFHQTTDDTIAQPAGLTPPPELQYGLHLAQRGMVALCPRNYLWDYRGRPGPEATFEAFAALVKEELLARYPHWSGMGKMLWDGERATDLLASLPEVDEERLGCVGHSLGAKEVLYALAFDSRMKAGVSSEGGLGIPFSNWDAPWYLGPGIHRRADLEHHQLLALAAPRALLVLGGGLEPTRRAADKAPGADRFEDWNYLEAARPAYDLYGASQNLALYLHDQGHAVPPPAEKLTYDWLAHFLS